jgi:halogenation protein CepH
MTMQEADVVIMGGGPAGSTCATLLAMKGHRVVLLEKDRFPRFMIGEGLLPSTWDIWERLGIAQAIESAGYPRKRGVRFRIEDTTGFYEDDIRTDEFPNFFIKPYSYHVDRGHFDQMLLDNARDKGVDAREGCGVDDVIFEGERAVGVRYTDENGEQHEIRSPVVVDTTGRRTLLGVKLKRRYVNANLRKVSHYTHWEGAGRRLSADGTVMTDIHTTEGGWIWFIPLRNDVMSVGVVLDADYVQKSDLGPQALYDKALAGNVSSKEWLANARPSFKLKHVPAVSYLADSFVGDGFVMLGDASMFIDPMFSAGVSFAMRGADFAATTISAALASGDVSAAALQPYEDRIRIPLQKLNKIICNWYKIIETKERQHIFRFSMRSPMLREQLVVILSGGYERSEFNELMASMHDDTAVAGPKAVAEASA